MRQRCASVTSVSGFSTLKNLQFLLYEQNDPVGLPDLSPLWP